MARKLLYIINPISGGTNKSNLTELIERSTKEAGILYEFVSSRADGNYQSLINDIAAKKITDIIICGGDGTVSQVIGALYKQPVTFGIIPMGSGNGLARAAKIPMNTHKALQLIFKGDSYLTDAISVNGQFACMLVGFGFDAAVAHSFANSSTRGLLTYIKEIVSHLFRRKYFPLSIQLESNKIDTEIFLLSIANGNQYGNEFRIAPHANLNDGLLDVVLLKKQPLGSLIKNIIRQVGHLKSPTNSSELNLKSKLIYFQTNYLKIETTAHTPFHIDGDPAGFPSKVEIKIIPAAYQLLRTK